jgi:hypothetical protein
LRLNGELYDSERRKLAEDDEKWTTGKIKPESEHSISSRQMMRADNDALRRHYSGPVKLGSFGVQKEGYKSDKHLREGHCSSACDLFNSGEFLLEYENVLPLGWRQEHTGSISQCIDSTTTFVDIRCCAKSVFLQQEWESLLQNMDISKSTKLLRENVNICFAPTQSKFSVYPRYRVFRLP